jgi:hypothetical protein
MVELKKNTKVRKAPVKVADLPSMMKGLKISNSTYSPAPVASVPTGPPPAFSLAPATFTGKKSFDLSSLKDALPVGGRKSRRKTRRRRRTHSR